MAEQLDLEVLIAELRKHCAEARELIELSKKTQVETKQLLARVKRTQERAFPPEQEWPWTLVEEPYGEEPRQSITLAA